MCLEIILNPLIDDQGWTKPIHANVCFGDKVALCHIFFPLAYAMGDGMSSDKMCGHFLGYSNVDCLSRVCNISFHKSEYPFYDCEQTSMYSLQQKSNKALNRFGLKEFVMADTIPHPSTLKMLQRRSRVITVFSSYAQFGIQKNMVH